MSSAARPFSRFWYVSFLSLIAAAPLAAQDAAEVPAEEAAEPETSDQFSGIDLSITVPKSEADQLIDRDCERENEAGKVTGEIVVCRSKGEASDGSWDMEEFEARYAEKTKGMSTPNTFGIPNHGNPIGFGSPPPPAIIVDFDALPEAPAGSDADRIARGLPPMGRDAELTPEEIARRRREAGLDTPDIAEAPE